VIINTSLSIAIQGLFFFDIQQWAVEPLPAAVGNTHDDDDDDRNCCSD
jgi:hypothetical protein